MTPLLLAALVVGPARAQGNSSQNCGVDTVIPSGSRDLMQQAATDNTNLYGAVGTAERQILPLLHEHQDMKIFLVEGHTLAGALHAPATAAGDCEDDLLLAPVDLVSTSWALAWSQGPVGAFYNASVTFAQAQGGAPLRGATDAIGMLGGVYYGLAAPFMPAGHLDTGDAIITWDYIAGVEATPGSVALRAGYVGSRGVYLQAAEKHSGAFLGAATNQTFARLPYLRGGIERLGIPAVQDRIGRSSLFGRKLILPRAPGTAAQAEGTDLYTGHVVQQDIAGIVDVSAAYAVEPTPFLHELRVGAHTEGFSMFSEDPESQGFRGVVGVVSVPEARYLDVEGGPRLSGSVEWQYRVDGRWEYSLIKASLRYNDPDVLVLFPYAENALDIYLLLSFGGQ